MSKIDMNIFGKDIHNMIIALALVMRFQELKERLHIFPGTQSQLKNMEAQVGGYFNILEDSEQKLLFDLKSLPCGKFFWIAWLEERAKKYPNEISALRFVFEKSIRIPSYLDQDEFKKRAAGLPNSSDFSLSDHWWNCLNPPLKKLAGKGVPVLISWDEE